MTSILTVEEFRGKTFQRIRVLPRVDTQNSSAAYSDANKADLEDFEDEREPILFED